MKKLSSLFFLFTLSFASLSADTFAPYTPEDERDFEEIMKEAIGLCLKKAGPDIQNARELFKRFEESSAKIEQSSKDLKAQEDALGCKETGEKTLCTSAQQLLESRRALLEKQKMHSTGEENRLKEDEELTADAIEKSCQAMMLEKLAALNVRKQALELLRAERNAAAKN